jgi:hypothetical protein
VYVCKEKPVIELVDDRRARKCVFVKRSQLSSRKRESVDRRAREERAERMCMCEDSRRAEDKTAKNSWGACFGPLDLSPLVRSNVNRGTRR